MGESFTYPPKEVMTMEITLGPNTYEIDPVEVMPFPDSPFKGNIRHVLYDYNGKRKAVLINDKNEIVHTVVS